MWAFLKRLPGILPCILANAGGCVLMDLPDFEPASRVIEHAEAYTAIHPEDPQGWRVLAEIHAVVLLQGAEFVEAAPSKPLAPTALLGFYYKPGPRDQGFAACLGEAARRALAKHDLVGQLADPEVRSSHHDEIMRELGHLITEHWKYKPTPAPPGISGMHARAALQAFRMTLALAPDDVESRFAAASFAASYLSYRAQAGPSEIADLPPAATPETLATEFREVFTLADKHAAREVEWGNPYPLLGPYIRFSDSQLDRLMENAAQAYFRFAGAGSDRTPITERLAWIHSVPRVVDGRKLD